MLKHFLSKRSIKKHNSELSDKEFLVQILNVCSKYPDVHNPVDQNANCYYTANSETIRGAHTNQHCLIGQWWVDYGHDVDLLPADICPADKFLESYYPDRICALARLIQDMADRRPVIVGGSNLPPLWRDVAVRIKNSFRSELS